MRRNFLSLFDPTPAELGREASGLANRAAAGADLTELAAYLCRGRDRLHAAPCHSFIFSLRAKSGPGRTEYLGGAFRAPSRECIFLSQDFGPRPAAEHC